MSIEVEVAHDDYNRKNNRLLDLVQLRRRNKDLFDEDTQLSMSKAHQRSQAAPISKADHEQSIFTQDSLSKHY